MLTCSNVFFKNKDAYKKDTRYIINQGGTSSTKTFSILQLLVVLSVKYPLKIDVAGQTGTHLRTGVLNDMPAVCEQLGINFDNNYKRAERVFRAGSGSINFLSFDKLGKAVGGRRDILYLNEANHQHYNIVEQLCVRTKKNIFIDYNPTSEFWVHDKLLKFEKDKCEFIKSTYKDNPFLEQSIIDSIEAKKGNNNFWRVYGLGEIGIYEGLVFKNFEEAEFDKNRFDKYYNGIDWGFSNDPFAFVRCTVEQDCLYITDEIYGKELLNKESAPLVKNIINREYVTCDNAEPKSVSDFYSLGINAIAAKKGAGSVESGIKYLQSFKTIYIHPDCPNTLTEFKNYQWKQDKNGENLPIPIDGFNHSIDALRYALESLVGRKKIVIPTTRPF